MKLAEYLGLEQGYHKGQIGLEIETECKTNYPYVDGIEKMWGIHPDGSLRENGIEYTFRSPYNHESKEYFEALAIFKKQADQTPFIRSTYSSVHVHLNMLDKELVQIANFITLYFLFEEFLAEYCGNSRNGNLFCLKTSNAELIYKTVKELFASIDVGSGVGYIKNLTNSLLKYSGLNLVPLRTFGSLEVRTHRGTTDITEIRRWIDMLMCMYRAADTYKNPVEIINRLYGFPTKEAFVRHHFGAYDSYFNFANTEEKMKDAIWYATSVVGVVNNWKNFGSKKNSIKQRSATEAFLEQYYQAQTMSVEQLTAALGLGQPPQPEEVNFIHPTTDQ